MKNIWDNIDPELICQRLKEVRLFLGFNSTSAFAKELNINYTTYRNYEKNRMPPSGLLILLKEKYGHRMNIDWLLAGEGEMTKKKALGDADAGKSNVAQFPIDEPKPSYQEDDPRITELLEAAKRVLKSGNEIAFDALERNIRYSDHSIQSEKRFQDVEGRMNNMENDVSEIKKYFKDFMDSQKEKKEGVHNI